MSSEDDLIKKYDSLRQQELEFLQRRHGADVELQKLRFEISKIADEIARVAVRPNLPCW